MSKRHRLAIGLVLGLSLDGAARAAGARTVDQPLVILTEEEQQDAENAAFVSSVRALAAEIGIAVSTEAVPSLQTVRDALLTQTRQATKSFLVAWILREAGIRKIYLFDPGKNQLRTRTVEAGTSATANAEALALILRAELVAHLNEQEPALPPSSPPSPPPAPPARSSPRPPRPDPKWAVASSYFIGTFLRDEGLRQGARFGLWRRWPHLRVGVCYGLVPGQDVDGEDITMTVRRHPFALDVGYASRERHRMRFVAEVVLSGDVVSRHTASVVVPLSAQPDDSRFLLSVGARGRAELRLFRNLALHLALGAEVPLNPYDFQIMRGTTPTTVARLSPVRVSAEVGVNLLAF